MPENLLGYSDTKYEHMSNSAAQSVGSGEKYWCSFFVVVNGVCVCFVCVAALAVVCILIPCVSVFGSRFDRNIGSNLRPETCSIVAEV